jgi:hypothetical protein
MNLPTNDFPKLYQIVDFLQISSCFHLIQIIDRPPYYSSTLMGNENVLNVEIHEFSEITI